MGVNRKIKTQKRTYTRLTFEYLDKEFKNYIRKVKKQESKKL
jgi:hypothetical protein